LRFDPRSQSRPQSPQTQLIAGRLNSWGQRSRSVRASNGSALPRYRCHRKTTRLPWLGCAPRFRVTRPSQTFTRKCSTSRNCASCDAMKLILQIAAGIVLGWLIISATQALLDHTALAQFARSMQTASPPLPAALTSSPGSSLDHAPNQPQTSTQPTTREQLDAESRADETRAKADRDATYSSAPPVQTIRKATPADAAAKPAN
jgi:hypothetical protein